MAAMALFALMVASVAAPSSASLLLRSKAEMHLSDLNSYFTSPYPSMADEWQAARSALIAMEPEDTDAQVARITEKLQGKWVYTRGDSTTRQVMSVWLSMLGVSPLDLEVGDGHKDKGVPDMKYYIRQHCGTQPYGDNYNPAAHPGWGETPCQLNEHTCHFSFPSAGFNVSWDWKHMVMQDRERWLYTAENHKNVTHEFHHRVPDVLVVGTGGHTCFHTNRQKGYEFMSEGARSNQTAEQELFAQIPELFALKRTVFKGPIIFIEAGVSDPHKFPEYCDCTRRFNQKVQEYAKTDDRVFVVPRWQSEVDYVRQHPSFGNVHKGMGCVADATTRLLAQMELALSRL